MTLHLTLDNDATKIRIRPNYGINNVTLNCDTYIYVCADVNETTSLLAGLAGQESLADPRLCFSTFK